MSGQREHHAPDPGPHLVLLLHQPPHRAHVLRQPQGRRHCPGPPGSSVGKLEIESRSLKTVYGGNLYCELLPLDTSYCELDKVRNAR